MLGLLWALNPTAAELYTVCQLINNTFKCVHTNMLHVHICIALAICSLWERCN